MKRLTLCVPLFFFTVSALAQEVDLVRLGYDKSNAKQIGMAASSDRKNIAFIYDDKTIQIFDVASGKFVKHFEGPYSSLFDVQLTSSGRIALITEEEVQIWDWKKGASIAKFLLARGATKTAFSPINNLLAVGQRGGGVSIFDLNSLKKIQEVAVKKNHVGALAFHPDGKKIVVGVIAALNFNPQTLTMFDVESGQELMKSTEKAYFSMVAFNESGDELMAAGLNAVATQVVMMTLDGATLQLKKKFDSQMTMSTGKVAYGGLVKGDRLYAVTLTQSFNVHDSKSGAMTFTTRAERGKAPAFIKVGIGSYNVFPLSADGSKVLLNATKNNINQIFDSKTNSIIGYFFSDSNENFAIVSRDGRVDGTPEALSRLYWTSRKSSKRASLESTFEKGFSPKLLAQVIQENATDKLAFEVDEVVDKIPVLSLKSVNDSPTNANASFETPLKKSKVIIEVMQNLDQAKEIKLYQNAKLVSLKPNQGDSKFAFDVVLNTSFGEDNFFYASATTKLGIESEKVKFKISYKGATDEKPTLYLITIGINQYKNPKYNLNYAEADANGFETAIQQSATSIFKKIVPYTIRNNTAIKENIYEAFENVRKAALEQDMLVVYYAGHGVMTDTSPDQPQEFYVVPHDVTQLYGRSELLQERAISASTLKKFAESINAQKQVFVLDACQSAGALEAMASRGAAEERAIAQLARSTGTFWITATGSDQFATEFEKLGHGIFTYALLEGMKGEADTNNDKKLTVRELSTYIENKVPLLSEQLKGTAQYPSAYSFGNDFPIMVIK